LHYKGLTTSSTAIIRQKTYRGFALCRVRISTEAAVFRRREMTYFTVKIREFQRILLSERISTFAE